MIDCPTCASGDVGNSRSTFLLIGDFERLEEWCRKVRLLFGHSLGLYLVGSILNRPDFRDVDLRLMLDDGDFDARLAFDDRWPIRVRYLNRAISDWGRRETELPIDFQVQRMTEANAAYPGPRNPMGIRDWFANRTSGVPA